MAVVPRSDVQDFAAQLRIAMKLGLGRTRKRNGRRGSWATWEFADACNVTPQSVSNWRQARNLPNTSGLLAIHTVISKNDPNEEEVKQVAFLEDSYWRALHGTTLIDEEGEDPLTPVEAIPRQTAGPHFAVGNSGKIAHSPPTDFDSKQNNIKRLDALRPLVIEDVDRLLAYIGGGTNAYADLFANVVRYRKAIDGDLKDVDWGLVWGLGVRLEETAVASERQITDRMMPALEDQAQASLNSVRTLHSQMILATSEGRELQQQADEYGMSRNQRAAFQQEARAIVESLKLDEEVIEASAADILQEAVSGNDGDRHPDRTTTFGIATIKHTAIVLIGAAVIAGPAAYVGGISGAALTMGVWEAMKKSPIYSAATAALGQTFSETLKSGGEKTQEALRRLAPFKNFVVQNEAALRHIALSTTQLSWMQDYINYITGKSPPAANDS